MAKGLSGLIYYTPKEADTMTASSSVSFVSSSRRFSVLG